MKLSSIDIDGFRNLQSARVALGERFNVVIGDNAQGKTNFLEALAVICELRSFRATRLAQLVGFANEQARLFALAEAGGLDYEVRLMVSHGARRLRVNDKAVTRQKDYLGSLPTVVFEPDDVRLSKGGPARRRRFLDNALFLLQPAHWDRVAEYNKFLKRRNFLLKERKTRDALFEVYSEKLATAGAAIAAERHRITAALQTLIARSIADVSAEVDQVELTYDSHLPALNGEPVDDGGQTLLAKLAEHLPRDREVGHTTVGPHVEDLQVFINGKPAGDFASQGQHRTVALALKIAEIEIVRKQRGITPLLLIDDLSSELDAGRRARLFEYLKRSGSQVVLTSTDPDVAAGFADEGLKTFTVSAGRISPSEPLTPLDDVTGEGDA